MTYNRPARIIFVEDNPAHIELAKRALEAEGFCNKVEFFSTAPAVIEYLDSNFPPDIIFIDRILSNSTLQGDDIANFLMADKMFSETEICMMSSSYVDREKENEYAASKIKFFLKKPLITEQLEAVIKSSKRLRKLIVVVDSKEAA